MSGLQRRIAIMFCLNMILPASVLTAQAPNQYDETFTSNTYKDESSTTAWWDTGGGELKLYPFQITPAGSAAVYAYDVELEGDYAYLVGDGGTLNVIDISDPTSPAVVGSYYGASLVAEGVAVDGNLAFVAAYYDGLYVIDISDPTNPTLVGSYDTPVAATDVVVSGDIAYTSDHDGGLQVIDVSDPSNPTQVGYYVTKGGAWRVEVSGDLAFVLEDENPPWVDSCRVSVIDVSDPANPLLVGNYDAPGTPGDFAVAGDLIYMLNGDLLVLNAADPAELSLVGSCVTPGFASGVAIDGDYAILGSNADGLQVVDISDPTNPVLLETYDTPGGGRRVSTCGGYAYLCSDEGLYVLRVAGAVLPPLPAGSVDTPDFAAGIFVAGDYAYVADTNNGLQVVDISDPTNPAVAGSYDALHFSNDVVVAGDRAYIADYEGGLRVIDVSAPTSPTLTATHDTPDRAVSVDIAGNYAYVADWSALRIIDISDPDSPVLAGQFASGTYDVTIEGNYAYTVDGATQFRVVDVSNPGAPSLAGSVTMPLYASYVAVSGDIAIVSRIDDGPSPVVVFDISDPTNPILVSSTPIGFPRRMDISGDYAFVANHNTGLSVLDIHDPSNPELLGSCDTPNLAYAVALGGDYAYVADGTSGLQVIEIFQRTLNLSDNVGRSTDIEPFGLDVIRAKLSSVQTDSIRWELSADGGTDWQEVASDGSWNVISPAGSDLRWRSTHLYAGNGENPSCDNVEIDWLYGPGIIDSIADVGGDDGGWMNLFFTRSAYDFAGEDSLEISAYHVFRRIPPLLAGDVGVERAPPGVWEAVDTVLASHQDRYQAVVPTLADSSSQIFYTAVYVSAVTVTPSVFFDSPVDSGYSLNNLPPAPPTGVGVSYNGAGNSLLSWFSSPEGDLGQYHIYRGTDEFFDPSPSNRVHSTVDTTWLDPVSDGWTYYYKLTAVDTVGNESTSTLASPPVAVDESGAPVTFALHQNRPNPFNPSTTIPYDVPTGGGNISITVYDVTGRLVVVLVDEYETPGRKSVVWDGRDRFGNKVASGIYFYRLASVGYVKRLKMTLIE